MPVPDGYTLIDGDEPVTAHVPAGYTLLPSSSSSSLRDAAAARLAHMREERSSVDNASQPQTVMTRFLHGAGLPTNQQEMTATARHLSPSGIIDNVRAGNYGAAAAGLAGPVGTAAYDLLHTIGSEMGDQAGQAVDAAQHREYGPALKHSLGAAVPLIGPPLAEGNVAGAAGRATGLAAPLVAGRMFGGSGGSAAPEAPIETTPVEAQPFYGDEGVRGPLDTTPPKPTPAPPTKLQQVAKVVKTGVGVIRHPILSSAAKVADVVADRLSPSAPSSARPLPPPSTPAAVAGLDLVGDVPPEPLPTSAGSPTDVQIAAARAAIAKQQLLNTPPDLSALPPSRMQPTSTVEPTAPATNIPTSSRQIALQNSLEDYTAPTTKQIPAPRSIARKTAQLEIGGEPVGTRVPYSDQLPDPTSTMDAARIKAETRLQRQIEQQAATNAIAQSTMKSKSFPTWAPEDQQAFGRAITTGDIGSAAAVSSLAEQRAAGISDPSFGAVNHLPDSAIIDIYRGNGVYIDPDGKMTQISPHDENAPIGQSQSMGVRDNVRNDESLRPNDEKEFARVDDDGIAHHQNDKLFWQTPMDELIPAPFVHARNALAQSQIDPELGSLKGQYGRNPASFGKRMDNADQIQQLPDSSNYDPRLSDGVLNTVTTFNNSANDPFVALHEYGHAVYERDLTPQQRKTWQAIHNRYQVRLDRAERAVPEFTSSIDEIYSKVKNVPEAIKRYSGDDTHSFPSLFAAYILDPVALNRKYPDVYYYMKRISGGREYTGTATPSNYQSPVPQVVVDSDQ